MRLTEFTSDQCHLREKTTEKSHCVFRTGQLTTAPVASQLLLLTVRRLNNDAQPER